MVVLVVCGRNVEWDCVFEGILVGFVCRMEVCLIIFYINYILLGKKKKIKYWKFYSYFIFKREFLLIVWGI